MTETSTATSGISNTSSDIARVGHIKKYHTRKEERENDSDVATGMNYGFASFSSRSKSICNTEMDITYKN